MVVDTTLMVDIPNPDGEPCGGCYQDNFPRTLVAAHNGLEWWCNKCFAKEFLKDTNTPWQYVRS